jgi:hypothetical protein
MNLSYLYKDAKGRLEVSSHFFQEGWSEVGVSQQLYILHRPVHEGFSDFDALEIRRKEGAWSFHLFHDEEKGENVEVFIVIVFSLEDIIGPHDWAEL